MTEPSCCIILVDILLEPEGMGDWGGVVVELALSFFLVRLRLIDVGDSSCLRLVWEAVVRSGFWVDFLILRIGDSFWELWGGRFF